MKQKLFIVSAIVSVLLVTASTSLAYFTAQGTATNVITTGNLSVAIVETTDKGEPFPKEGVKVMPGDVVSKIVAVENTSTHPAYVRVKLAKSINDASLSAEQSLIISDLNTTDWTYSDGYYYYNTVLPGGEKTTPLFTRVQIVGEVVDNAYIGKNFTLDVMAYGVQSENNGSSVWTAAGWPE